MSMIWKFLHYALTLPLLFLAEVVGHGVPAATRFYAATKAKGWPPPADAEERRLEVWEKLRLAEDAAETCGYEALSDALGLVAVLWAAGFEDLAEEALAGAAAPLLAGLDPGEHAPKPAAVAVNSSPLECPHGRPAPSAVFWPIKSLDAAEATRFAPDCPECLKAYQEDVASVWKPQLVNAVGKGRVTGKLLLLALLLAIPAGAASYPRPDWRDDDHDCQSTRTEVLVRTCSPVVLSPSGCKVVQATCLDIYSGAEVASDTPAQTFHVDHIFPASVAYQRRAWTLEKFADFFNDTRNLLVTRARTNLRKSDRMPHQWCPAERGARLLVAKRFRRIARAYGLRVLPAEEAGLRAWEAGTCAVGAVVL